MTCYFRHLKGVFEKAGIEVTSQNRHELDEIIRGLVGVEDKNCPATWKEVTKRIAEDEQDFVTQLKAAWKRHDH